MGFEEFGDASLEDLVKHALFALRETAGQRSEGLTAENTTIAIVGLDHPFTIYEDESVQPYVSRQFCLFVNSSYSLMDLFSWRIWPWKINSFLWILSPTLWWLRLIDYEIQSI